MSFRNYTVSKKYIIQAAFVLSLIYLVIYFVDKPQPPIIPESVRVIDTTARIIPDMADAIIESIEPSTEIMAETGINQTQTHKGSTPTPASSSEAHTGTFIVPTHVQAENLFDQGYSVKEIAKELGLDKKEVRKLRRKQKREEKATIAKRKRENKMKEKKSRK